MPKVGDDAPDFETMDVYGRPVKLSDYTGKPVLVAFMRYAGCPWCNLALHRLVLEYPMLQKQDCEVLAFVQSDEETIKTNIYGRHNPLPPFPIIADPDRHIYDLYGIKRGISPALKAVRDLPYWARTIKKLGFEQQKIDGDFFLVPAIFLISGGRQQKILHQFESADFYGHESFIRIYEPLIFHPA